MPDVEGQYAGLKQIHNPSMCNNLGHVFVSSNNARGLTNGLMVPFLDKKRENRLDNTEVLLILFKSEENLRVAFSQDEPA